MNIVAIDTFTESISVTAEGINGRFTEIMDSSKKRHSEILIPMLDRVICQAGFIPSDTEIVLCAEGPGAFTGLRVGYATAKAIELQSNAKFIPIPTIECMKLQLDLYSGQLLVLIDAKRNCFYGQLFENNMPKTDVLDVPFDHFLNLIKLEKKCIIYGIGIRDLQHVVLPEIQENVIFMEDNGPLSVKLVDYFHLHESKLILTNTEDVAAPMYFRKSDAEKS